MGQQQGDGSFDFEIQQPPAGIRVYDPNISEVAHHVGLVCDAIDLVEFAALRMKYCAIGDQCRQSKNADP